MYEKFFIRFNSEEELIKVLQGLELEYKKAQNPEGNKQDYKAHLKYVLFLTLAEVGMRASELAGIKVKDVDFSGKLPRLHLHVKGGELHGPLISDGLALLLKKYISVLRKQACAVDPLFSVTPYSKTPLNRHFIASLIKEVAKKNGITKDISPHSLRATAASLLHQKNVPIGEIQALLGHRSILTTMMYIKLTDEEKQSAGRKLNLIGGDG